MGGSKSRLFFFFGLAPRWETFFEVDLSDSRPIQFGPVVNYGENRRRFVRDIFEFGARGRSSVRYGTRLGDLKNKQHT